MTYPPFEFLISWKDEILTGFASCLAPSKRRRLTNSWPPFSSLFERLAIELAV